MDSKVKSKSHEGPELFNNYSTQCKDIKIVWGQAEFNGEVNLRASTSEK